jgi:DNA-binding CsgD family transcriptional regulator
MALDERLLAVIHAMYDAALDERLWPEALKRLAEATGSQGASFWVLDASPQPRLPTFTTINFDPAFIRDYLDGMVPMDPTVQYLVAYPDKPVVHDGLVITERGKDRHPYYDWQRRNSDIWYRIVGQARPAPLVQAGVALHRTRAAGQYDDGDLEQFAMLQGHLQRALAIGFRLGSLGTMRECTTELLDRNPAAVLLVDSRKRVVYSNRRAAALCAGNDGIRITAQGVTLSSKLANEKLQRLIAEALTPISGRAPGATMQAARPSGKRPYVVFVSSMPVRARALSELRPAACLVITDPSDRRPLTTDRLKAAFGFTEAEARLASLLVSGQSLRSAAAALRITYGTARVRLAELFQKTETRRQGELIGLLLATLMAP